MPNRNFHSPKGMSVDVRITNHGSLFLFHLLSERGSEWVEDYVNEDRMMFGAALVVESRFALDLVRGMLQAGLDVD